MTEQKLINLHTAAVIAMDLRRAGRRLVFTNGCFDLFHGGHLSCLQEAKAQGDVLIVALNSDISVRTLKGDDRPLRPAAERAAIVAALNCVDYVVLFEELTPIHLIEELLPDVLAKGGDHAGTAIVGRAVVEARGGRVHLCARSDALSVTELVARIAGMIERQQSDKAA